MSRRTRPVLLRTGWSIAALLAVLVAVAWPTRGRTLGELSNFALVKALADGTPTIDRTRAQVGDLAAGDFRTYRGHVYSDKAPGLAFVTLPGYLVLHALRLDERDDPTNTLWALRLFGVVLPCLVLLLLVGELADRIAPGYGTATAVALGVGTLVPYFATTFFSNVLAATLVLGSFALLWKERDGAPRLWLVAAAGLVAGFGFTTEYQTALSGAVFGIYALLRTPRLARGAAYAGGVALGVVPLLLYNQWAFGSPTHLSYFGELNGSDLGSGTLASWIAPSAINTLFTYLAASGMLVVAPVLACALVALVLMYRQGMRVEALVIAGIAAAFTLYNASLPGIEYDAFLAGPRYLVAIVPVLILPLGLAFRRWPLTTAALGLVSAILITAMTASLSVAGTDPRWFHALVERRVATTAASVVGITGWYAIFGYFVAVGAAIVFAGIATTRSVRVSPRDAPLAGLAVLTWALAAAYAPHELTGEPTTYAGYVPVALALLAFAAAIGAAGILLPRRLAPRSG